MSHNKSHSVPTTAVITVPYSTTSVPHQYHAFNFLTRYIVITDMGFPIGHWPCNHPSAHALKINSLRSLSKLILKLFSTCHRMVTIGWEIRPKHF